MRNRTLTTGLMLLGAMALLLPACASGGGGSAGTADLPRDGVGEKFMDDQLELTGVQGPDDGEMIFTISNISGAPLEDLTARVLFYLPPSGPLQKYDTEAVERPFSAFADESIPIKVRPATGTNIKGWAVYVQPAVTVSRAGEAKRTGSMFLGDTLECVAITDKLTARTPSVEFEIENLTGEVQELLEYEVVLTKEGKGPGTGTWKSGWMPIGDKIDPNKTIILTPDVSGSPVSGAVSILLKIQRSVL